MCSSSSLAIREAFGWTSTSVSTCNFFDLVLVCNGKAAWKGRVREVMRSSQLGCRANETNWDALVTQHEELSPANTFRCQLMSPPCSQPLGKETKTKLSHWQIHSDVTSLPSTTSTRKGLNKTSLGIKNNRNSVRLRFVLLFTRLEGEIDSD